MTEKNEPKKQAQKKTNLYGREPDRKDSKIMDSVFDEAEANNLTPLEYMIEVMNDLEAESTRRDKMAISAAPYLHPRFQTKRVSKRDENEEKARSAGQGMFAPSVAPKLKAIS